MKKLCLYVVLFFALTAHAKMPEVESLLFLIDADGLVQQKIETQDGKTTTKPFTGKIRSLKSKSVWVVVDGVKTDEEYPVFFGKDPKRTRVVYQKPDGTVYTTEDETLFTGVLTLDCREISDGWQELCTYQKYKDGRPKGPKYQGTRKVYRVRKPIIYLYPQATTTVNVKVGHPEKFTHTYPKYMDGWRVLAQPNGDLTDLQTGRHLYALYWEGLHGTSNTTPDGFVVKGSDTISFLEEKLATLGLTEREANEFIIYWLPKLENNTYNLIRFQSIEQQNQNMPLDITPAPDTLIRVLMEYKPLNKKVDLPEQILPSTPARPGFTVVEWGGTELKGE